MTKLTRNQRRCLADAYAARGRRGLKRATVGVGWRDEDFVDAEYHAGNTVHSLVERGLLSMWVDRTVAHVTDHGAAVHEALCEGERTPNEPKKEAS